MTWIIGAPTMFSYAVALADVQATLIYTNGKRRYIDGVVQKIFPIERFIAAGYSGSIEIGFFLIEDLKKWAVLTDKKTTWIPDCIVQKWHRRARWLFSKIDKKKQSFTEVILLGVYPQKSNGIPGESQTYCCSMKSPDFIPSITVPGRICSIGSGNDIQTYKKIIEDLSAVYNPLMQLEVQNPGGYGRALSLFISLKVKDDPQLGISKHFHTCYIKRGEVTISANNYSITNADGSIEIVKMPKVATNWQEFLVLMKKKGITLARACAVG